MWKRHIHTGTQNVHNVHNAHIDNIGIPKHEKHLRLLSSGTKLFKTFELKRFLDMRKREAQSFYDEFSICPSPPTTTRDTCRKPQRSSESQPSSSDGKTLLTFLKSQPTLPVRGVTHIPGHILYLGFLLWHLWMTRPLRTRVNTCAHVCT